MVLQTEAKVHVLGSSRAPVLSGADVAGVLTVLCTALGCAALLAFPMGTSVTQIATATGEVSPVVRHTPAATLGEALPWLVLLVLVTAAPLLLRRTAAARASRVALAVVALAGVLLSALSVGWLFLPAAACAVVAAALEGPQRPAPSGENAATAAGAVTHP